MKTVASLLAWVALWIAIPVPAWATPTSLPELTGHWVGIAALILFILAYALVMTEEITYLRKSKPVVLAAGVIWMMVAWVYGNMGLSHEVEAAVRGVFLEYTELMLFLLVAMAYINALEERRVFRVLQDWLVRSGFGYRQLFWLTGILAFFISSVADNLTTPLLMSAVVLAVGRDEPRFVALSCINLVVAANAGGAFSPFGDITTLMVWQKGVVPFWDFFRLFVPSAVNFLVPAAIMHWAIPPGRPAAQGITPLLKPGAKPIAALFALTIALAVSFHSIFNLPPVLGMMTGLSLLHFYGYYMNVAKREREDDDYAIDMFRHIVRVEWDTLLFFYGVTMCVGALGVLGYLALISQWLYGPLGATTANVLLGIVSAVIDNIPMMFAILTLHPDMSLGQWLLITLTAGVGGSLLSIGSAAGVALMGQARGVYTFLTHLRWTWAVALGYVASILTHWVLNSAVF
ncbi:Na(+)/H(+) antiporter NhaD [Gammaproteobacteria bacterium]